jgi:8-oxo-dGTP pyrophosphatase MutT (NUDIX family)
VDGAASGEEPCSSASLTAVVAAHRPSGAREVAARERILAELDRLPRPCEQAADVVHVTASAVIVGPRGTVLHLHRRLRRWMQPGGHIDAGEGPAEAALRESREETGLVLAHPPSGPQMINVDVHDAAEGHTHLDLRYLLVGGTDDPEPPPEESQDVRWFEWPEALAMADEALVVALGTAHSLWDAHGAEWSGTGVGGSGDAGGPDLPGPPSGRPS